MDGAADGTGEAAGGGEADQDGHGIEGGAGAVRGGAAGLGADGSPEYREGFGCGGDAGWAAVLCAGASQGRADYEVLRCAPPDAAPAAGDVRAGVPGDSARASEGNHSPRSEAEQRAGCAIR